MRLWNTLKPKLKQLFGRRRNRDHVTLDPGEAGAQAAGGFTATNEQSTSKPAWHDNIPDVTDETVFKRYAGVSEDEFLTQVLSVLEKAKEQAATGEETVEDSGEETAQAYAANIPSAGVPRGRKKLFERLEIVKRLRVLEGQLAAGHQQVAITYPFTWYTDIFKKIQEMGGKEETGEGTGEAVTPGETKYQADADWIFASLKEQAAMEISRVREFAYGQSHTGETGGKETGRKDVEHGTLEALRKDFEERRTIKQLRLQDVKSNLDYFNNKKAEQVYQEAADAYTSYFWSLLGISLLFILVTFLSWYLISPLEWKYLPLALLFAAVLLLIPARGFARLFEQKKMATTFSEARGDEKIKVVTEEPDKSRNWQSAVPSWNWLLVAFDIFIPLSIVSIMLFINWNLAGVNWHTIAIMTAVFLFLTCIRICTFPLVNGFRQKYDTARQKLFIKKAFVKYYREHLLLLKEAGLADLFAEKETAESLRMQLDMNKQVSKRIEEILFNKREMSRQLLSSMLKDNISDQQVLKDAFFTEPPASPNSTEIPDLATVRKMLARLEYLFDMASAS